MRLYGLVITHLFRRGLDILFLQGVYSSTEREAMARETTVHTTAVDAGDNPDTALASYSRRDEPW